METIVGISGLLGVLLSKPNNLTMNTNPELRLEELKLILPPLPNRLVFINQY